MKTTKTKEDIATVQELREKREKISKDLSEMSPEQKKLYIDELLKQKKDKSE